MIGRVVSTKMNNTATVLVERTSTHPLYKKTFMQSKKYLVDAPASIKDGDIVEIVKVRPISKNKHWKIVKVVGKNLTEINEEKLKAEAEKVIAEVMPETSESVDQSVSGSEKEETDKKKEVAMDNSAEKPKLRKKGKAKVAQK